MTGLDDGAAAPPVLLGAVTGAQAANKAPAPSNLRAVRLLNVCLPGCGDRFVDIWLGMASFAPLRDVATSNEAILGNNKYTRSEGQAAPFSPHNSSVYKRRKLSRGEHPPSIGLGCENHNYYELPIQSGD